MTIYTYKPNKPISYSMPIIITVIIVAVFSFVGFTSFIDIEALPTSTLFLAIAFAIGIILVSFGVVCSKPKAFQVDAEGERLFIESDGKKEQIKKVSHFTVPNRPRDGACYGCRVTTERGTIRLKFAKEVEICAFCMAVQSKTMPKAKDEHASQEKGMKLDCESLIITQNADADDIRTVFTNGVLTWEYIVLSKTENGFIQTSHNGDGTFVLEYREDNDDHYSQCTQELQKGTVEQAFLKYLDGDTSWQHDFPWERITD